MHEDIPNKGFSLVGKPVVFVGQLARFFLYFDAPYRRRQHAQCGWGLWKTTEVLFVGL